MRLLNVWTLEITEFMDSDAEIYAILSHTWETEEVTFGDFRASSVLLPVGFNKDKPWLECQIPTVSEPGVSMRGFKKIIGLCQKARMEGYDWVWIDTCCIDKSSSAELSEAINSMFQWYENARWFTRGWTLQEPTAPLEVVFFAADWEEIGSRWELSWIISEITGIDEKVLKDPAKIVEFSSAQRMSWASMRKTTRIEDQAYSLLGIFNVHMPLLYGEGSNAFKRLQIEVLNSSNDCSLLAWEEDEEAYAKRYYPGKNGYDRYDPNRYTPGQESGLLAKNVEMFRNAGSILRIQQNWLQDESLRRSGIYIQADNQTVDYNGPVYGPLDQRGAHLGGLSKTLSSRASRCLIQNSRKLRNLYNPKETPLEEFIYAPYWANVCIALVGKLSHLPMVDAHDDPTSISLPQLALYIAILLDRTPGQPITRFHWPPLLIVDLTNTRELRAWPLTLVNAAIHIGQKPTEVSSIDKQGFLAGPKEYSLVDMDECETKWDECYRMQYNPARMPCRILRPFCCAMEFSGGPLPALPTFTLYFDTFTFITYPYTRVTFRKGPYCERRYGQDEEMDLQWMNLPFHIKTSIQISEEKFVTVLRRPAQTWGGYIVGIGDLPPAPLPPPFRFVCPPSVSNSQTPWSSYLRFPQQLEIFICGRVFEDLSSNLCSRGID